jgi:DNA gyrase/topoisomerase IV subunit B
MATFVALTIVVLFVAAFTMASAELAGHAGTHGMTFTRKKVFSTEEIAEARRYASIFGLDNEVDVNIEELIEMGRKYEEFLGTDVIDSIVEQHENFVVAYLAAHDHSNSRPARSKRNRHFINVMLNVQDLVAHAAPSFTNTITKTFGGDRNDETQSSLYAAA